MDFGSYKNIQEFKEKFKDFSIKYPRRYAEIIKSTGVVGHNIHNAKNCQNCFGVYEKKEEGKNLFIAGWELKDSRNSDHVGHKAELMYEFMGGGGGASKIFSFFHVFINIKTVLA